MRGNRSPGRNGSAAGPAPAARWAGPAALLALVLVASPAGAPPVRAGGEALDDSAPRIIRADPRLDALIPPSWAIEVLADGFSWTEGPVWSAREEALYFSDIPANAVHRWTRGEGPRLHLARSGYSGSEPFSGREPGANGLLLDPRGRLILCEHGDRRITRLEADGSRVVLADRYQGRRLNSPNDAVLRSDGSLYFTDPPFGLPGTFEDPGKELPFSGVYRLSPRGDLTLLTRELTSPNGIAFAPGERTLYVSDAVPDRPRYLAFEVLEDGSLGRSRLFFDASAWAARWPGSADGIEVDGAGNLYVAGPGGILVLSPGGEHLGTIHLGRATSNLTWIEGGSALVVTAGSTLYRVGPPLRSPGPASRDRAIGSAP